MSKATDTRNEAYSTLRKHLAFAVIYGAVYWLLFWLASFFDSAFFFSLWFPAAGVRLAALLFFGWQYGFAVFLGEIGAQMLHGFHELYLPDHPIAMIISIGNPPLIYSLAAFFLLERFDFKPSLARFRDVIWLLAASIVISAIASPTSCAVLTYLGVFETKAYWSALRSFWVGDTIGNLIFAPSLLWLVNTLPRYSYKSIWHGWKAHWKQQHFKQKAMPLLEATLLLFFLILAFDPFTPNEDPVRWYPLFVPLIWLTLRYGFSGSIIGIVALNIGAASFAILSGNKEIVPNLQIFMVSLTLTGLLMGAVVTQRQKAEETARNRQNELAHISRIGALGEMASSLAHELNQPLAALSTYTQISLDKLNGPEPQTADLKRLLEKADAQAKRAGQITNSIRRLSKKGAPELKTFDLGACASEIGSLTTPYLKKHGAFLKVDIPQQKALVTADPIQIQQVFINLLNNAADAVGKSRSVKKDVILRVAALNNGWVEASVSNWGESLTEIDFENLFEPFVSTKENGMGMGLPICRTIIEAHGGHIWGQGNAEGRATFTFKLPAKNLESVI